MQPIKFDLEIRTNADINEDIYVTDKDTGAVIDLTGYTGVAKIYDTAGGTLKATITVTITALTGKINLFCDKTNFSAMPDGAAYVWDLVLTHSTIDEVWFEGAANVKLGVS